MSLADTAERLRQPRQHLPVAFLSVTYKCPYIEESGFLLLVAGLSATIPFPSGPSLSEITPKRGYQIEQIRIQDIR